MVHADAVAEQRAQLVGRAAVQQHVAQRLSISSFSSGLVKRRQLLSRRAVSKQASRPNTNTMAGTSPAAASSRTTSTR